MRPFFGFLIIIALCSVIFYVAFFISLALPLISARFPLRIIQAVTCLLTCVASRFPRGFGAKKDGSIKVSGKLPTYPSPKPTLTFPHLGQNVGLGEE